MRLRTSLALVSYFVFVVLVAQEKQAPPLPSTTEKQLSEVTKLKIENHQLKIALTQCQVNLLDRESKMSSTNLSEARIKLEAEINKELGCTKFDWVTLKCAK